MRWFKTRALVMAGILVAPGLGVAAGSDPAAAPAEVKGTAEAAPVLEPGIPGLKMVDVRDHKHLWREIEELQSWERSDRISIAEYRSKVIEKTAQFLGFEGAAVEQFTAASTAAVASVRESFRAGRRPEVDPTSAQTQLAADLEVAAARVAAVFRPEPRHKLFVPDCRKWLLRLAFGPSEAKEAREAKQAEPGEAAARTRP